MLCELCSRGSVKSEEDPLDPRPVSQMRDTLAAIRHPEEAVLGARWTEGIVLGYGAFSGSGPSMAPGGEQSKKPLLEPRLVGRVFA
jgi:hypothetical protein